MRHGIVVLTLLLGGCTGAGNSGGDRILDWKISEVAHLQAPDDGLTAVPWGVVADPSRRRIFVLDPPNARILVFDSRGRYSASMGRRGEGPGEFEDPWATSLRADGTLSVLDPQIGRIARVTQDGEWLSAEPLPAAYWGPAFADLGDRFAMVTSRPSEDPLEIRQVLVEVGRQGTKEIATTSQYQTELTLPCLSGPATVPKPVAPEPIWTTAGDTVLVVSGREYAIDLYEHGERVGTFGRPVAPFEVTEEMAIERISSGQLNIFVQRCDVPAATVAAGMDWSATVAPVQGLAVAPDGRVWATRTATLQQDFLLDVFDRSGEYLGTVESPVAPVSFLAPHSFVGYRLDEFGGYSLILSEVVVN